MGTNVPERAGRDGDQELPVAGDGDVIEELRGRLAERRELGIRRYGRALQRFNGRDAFRDAEDELLDQYVYLTQVRGEHRAIVVALLVLARHARGEPVARDILDHALELARRLEGSG
jgi:GNAT superfamily N-acetyltransferase